MTTPRVTVLLDAERHELVGRLAEIIGLLLVQPDLIEGMVCGRVVVDISSNATTVFLEPRLKVGRVVRGPKPPDSGEV